MATEKTLKARVKMKHGKESEWALATKFTPLIGEIIVYDVDNNHTSPRFKVGDGITNVNNLKFVNQDELAKITTLGDDLLAVKNGYLPLSGGTVTGALTVNKELYSNAAIISKRNSSPQLILQNANGAQLGSIYSGTSDGSYSDVLISVNSSSSDVVYFGFAKNGQFTAPNNIYSKGTLVSQTNSYPGLTIQNASGANLAMLYSNGTNGGYSNTVLRVYSSASEYSSFSFGKDGTFTAPAGITTTGNYVSIKNSSYPQLTFSNANGADLGKVFVSTANGSYAETKIRAYSSASAYYDFQFVGNGTFNCATLAPTNALGIAYGGTGATTAAGACSNIGALPKSGGVISGTLTVAKNGSPSIILANASNRYSAHLSMSTSDGSYGNVLLTVYSAASTTKVFSFDNDGTFVAPKATFDEGMVEVGGDDNQGEVGLGNANMGDWIYLRSSDEGALTVDNNLVYSDGTSVIYSSSTPSTIVKGTIWLKPI